MHRLTCYLDFISPYAWLAFVQQPEQLAGLSYCVQYRPVLLGALLKAHGNPGPAGIAPKYAWTRRHVGWLGQSLGCGLDWPAQHPFDPLPLLRLALQCSADGTINRFTADAVLRHVWLGGGDALASERLQALRTQLQPQLRSSPEQARAWLRSNTDAAQARGVFGVPSWVLEDAAQAPAPPLFWGLDSLPMLRACLAGDSASA